MPQAQLGLRARTVGKPHPYDEANRVIALLAQADPSNYSLTILRSKLDGENALRASGADWRIVRPSLLDGDGGVATVTPGPTHVEELRDRWRLTGDLTPREADPSFTDELGAPRVASLVAAAGRPDSLRVVTVS